MTDYVIKIGFSTNNIMDATHLLGEIAEWIAFDNTTEIKSADVLLTKDVLTQADHDSDSEIENELGDAFRVIREFGNE